VIQNVQFVKTHQITVPFALESELIHQNALAHLITTPQLITHVKNVVITVKNVLTNIHAQVVQKTLSDKTHQSVNVKMDTMTTVKPFVKNVHHNVKLVSQLKNVLNVLPEETNHQRVNVHQDHTKKITFAILVHTNVKFVLITQKNVSNVMETELTHLTVLALKVISMTETVKLV
jgi:hypothetical protein